jgi:hypothetical protein
LYDAFYAHEDITDQYLFQSLGETVPLAKTMDEPINRLRNWVEGRARNASVPRGGGRDLTHRRMEF